MATNSKTRQAITTDSSSTTKVTHRIANLTELFATKSKITSVKEALLKGKPRLTLTTEAKTSVFTTNTTKLPTSTTSTTTAMTTTTTSTIKLELSSPFSVVDMNGFLTDDTSDNADTQHKVEPIFVDSSRTTQIAPGLRAEINYFTLKYLIRLVMLTFFVI